MKRYTKEILLAALLFWSSFSTALWVLETTRTQHLEEVQNAYADYLHELWISFPNTIEEGSMDGDAFQRLSEVADFDAADTPFRFSSPTDSITYHQNWEAGY